MATATAKKQGRKSGTKKVTDKLRKKSNFPPPKEKKKQAPKGRAVDPRNQATLLTALRADDPNITSDDLAIKFAMLPDEIARMRGFIVEYVKDFDEQAAALRMGYPLDSARATGRLLLYNSYTQLRLSEFLSKAEGEALVTTAQIVAGFVKEANRADTTKDGCLTASSNTRLTAWKELAKIKGMFNPKPKEEAQVIRRVMLVPVPVDWEAGARASQQALIESTAIDV